MNRIIIRSISINGENLDFNDAILIISNGKHGLKTWSVHLTGMNQGLAFNYFNLDQVELKMIDENGVRYSGPAAVEADGNTIKGRGKLDKE